jgi:hypothetical protein
MLDPQITLEKFLAINSKNAQQVIRNSDVDGPRGPLHAAHALRHFITRSAYNADVTVDLHPRRSSGATRRGRCHGISR